MSDRIAVMSEGVIEQVGRPEEIYHRPASLFVAGFIGSANLLPGAVVAGDGDGDDTVIELNGGRRVRAAGAAPFERGARVSLMVRPERLRLGGADDGDGADDGRSLAGTVTQMIFQGPTARLHADLPDGTELVASLDPDDDLRAVRPGAPVRLGWAPGAAFLLAGWPQQAGATSLDVDRVEAAL
jgi:spermidine/putrescine transport system ATP-binding protein